jgi:hypothetical protein
MLVNASIVGGSNGCGVPGTHDWNEATTHPLYCSFSKQRCVHLDVLVLDET